MVDKTPEFTGSVQYIERCDGLIRSYHNFMVERNFQEAIMCLRSFHGEINPYLSKDEQEKISLMRHKVVTVSKPTVANVYEWFETLNGYYHHKGFAIKMNNKAFMREV